MASCRACRSDAIRRYCGAFLSNRCAASNNRLKVSRSIVYASSSLRKLVDQFLGEEVRTYNLSSNELAHLDTVRHKRYHKTYNWTSARLTMCPRCSQPSLQHTGLFWQCSCCRLAITHSALRQECDRTSATVPLIHRARHHRKEYA